MIVHTMKHWCRSGRMFAIYFNHYQFSICKASGIVLNNRFFVSYVAFNTAKLSNKCYMIEGKLYIIILKMFRDQESECYDMKPIQISGL